MHEEISRLFGPGIAQRQASGAQVVYTWGDVLHNPGRGPVPGHLMVHELVHSRQQKDPIGGQYDPRTWWSSYIASNQFRLRQEVEAYGREYAFACRVMNRKGRIGFMHKIAGELSGPLYKLGKVINKEDAIDLISREASYHESDDFAVEIAEFLPSQKTQIQKDLGDIASKVGN